MVSKCFYFIPVYWGSIVIAILSFIIAMGHFTLMVYGYSSLEKLTTLENVSLFGAVALIFIQLIFAYSLLKKKPNFILIWILGEAVNLVVRLHSILKCYCLTLISIINISMSNFCEQSLEKSHFTN